MVANMPYYTDNEENVYYVLTSVNHPSGSLVPVKSAAGELLEIGGVFKFDPSGLFSEEDKKGLLPKAYIVEQLPAIRDLRLGSHYPPMIAIRMEGLKSSKVKILSVEYVSYENRVFVSTLSIDCADTDTFFIYPESLYSKDKNQVYYRDKTIKKANPETFQIISPQFQKDDEHVWYMGSLLCADSNTFRVFTCERAEHPEKRMSLYACDKNHVFYQYLILDDADLKTFRVLKSAISDELYGIDERRVFYHHMYLEYADAKTFRVVTENDRLRIDHPDADAYDINYKYTCGNRIPLTEKEKQVLFL
jgi:hypothetical protein